MEKRYKKGEPFSSFKEFCDYFSNGPAVYYDIFCMKEGIPPCSFESYYETFDRYAPAIEIKTKEVTLFRFTYQTPNEDILQSPWASKSWSFYRNAFNGALLKTESKAVTIEGE